MKILVSAGHSTLPPRDPGAVGNGFTEAVEAVKIRDAVAAYLRESRIEVLEDGFDGESEPLKKALALARTADIAIEIHFNAGPPKATGIEVLAKPVHRLLAQQIALAIHLATKLTLRGDRGYKADNSGQHPRLAFCEAGGLIVEVCFISNPSDMNAYKSNFESMCQNIAKVLSSAAISGIAQSSQPPILKIGDKGDAVTKLQNRLYFLGFLDKQSDIDGDFGRTTERAVKDFQTKEKLEIDGIVGAVSARRLGLV